MPKYNPFKPGSIVHPGMFAGRIDELKSLEQIIHQTKNGNPTHFLIHGERGIGKSSLLLLLSHWTRGLITSLENIKYNFLTISVEVEQNDLYESMIRKIGRELIREIGKNPDIKSMLGSVWDFVSKWEVLGVKYKGTKTFQIELLDELVDRLCAVSKKLANTHDGIYIFIDEADKISENVHLGTMIKVLTERLMKNGCTNIGIGIVGISNVIDKLRESHESSVRILLPLELKPLLPDERKMVVRMGLDDAKVKDDIETTITKGALDKISQLSEGYPHFIQQYAYSAFEEDDNNNINIKDLETSLLKENGALDQLGTRHFEMMYSSEINSDDYRKVLNIMAIHNQDYITKKSLIKITGLKEHTVTNAVSALRKKNIIIDHPHNRGVYKLPSLSFAAWIRAFKKAKK